MDASLYDSDQARVGEMLELPAQRAQNPQGYATRMRDVDGNDVICRLLATCQAPAGP